MIDERTIKNDNLSKWLIYKFAEKAGFTDVNYTPGKYDHVDLFGKAKGKLTAIEVKNRYCESTRYTDNRCDSDKLQEIKEKYEGRAILASIYTDNVIKIGKFKDAVIQEMDNQPRNTYFGGTGIRKTKQAVIIPDDKCWFVKYEMNSAGQPIFSIIKKPKQ